MAKKSQQSYMQDMVDGMVPSALPAKKKSSGRKPPAKGKKGKPAAQAKENPYAKP